MFNGWKVTMKSLSCVRPFVTPWTVAIRLLCPWVFPGKNTSGLPFPSPGDLPDPGIKHRESPALQVDSLPLSHQEIPDYKGLEIIAPMLSWGKLWTKYKKTKKSNCHSWGAGSKRGILGMILANSTTKWVGRPPNPPLWSVPGPAPLFFAVQ